MTFASVVAFRRFVWRQLTLALHLDSIHSVHGKWHGKRGIFSGKTMTCLVRVRVQVYDVIHNLNIKCERKIQVANAFLKIPRTHKFYLPFLGLTRVIEKCVDGALNLNKIIKRKLKHVNDRNWTCYQWPRKSIQILRYCYVWFGKQFTRKLTMLMPKENETSRSPFQWYFFYVLVSSLERST